MEITLTHETVPILSLDLSIEALADGRNAPPAVFKRKTLDLDRPFCHALIKAYRDPMPADVAVNYPRLVWSGLLFNADGTFESTRILVMNIKWRIHEKPGAYDGLENMRLLGISAKELQAEEYKLKELVPAGHQMAGSRNGPDPVLLEVLWMTLADYAIARVAEPHDRGAFVVFDVPEIRNVLDLAVTQAHLAEAIVARIKKCERLIYEKTCKKLGVPPDTDDLPMPDEMLIGHYTVVPAPDFLRPFERPIVWESWEGPK